MIVMISFYIVNCSGNNFVDFAWIFFCAATIFAYGQTSSGKTYTMRGITEYAVEDIYHYMKNVCFNEKTKLNFFMVRHYVMMFNCLSLFAACWKGFYIENLCFGDLQWDGSRPFK